MGVWVFIWSPYGFGEMCGGFMILGGLDISLRLW
jgi:hypothetical protein